jgi:hypothetical protein
MLQCSTVQNRELPIRVSKQGPVQLQCCAPIACTNVGSSMLRSQVRNMILTSSRELLIKLER